MKKWFVVILLFILWSAIGVFIFQNTSAVCKNIPPQKIERIVCLAPSLTEIAYSLGLEKKIVGVTTFSNYPFAAKEKPKIGSFWQPDIEAVIAVRPQLVLTLRFAQQLAVIPRLERLGINTLALPYETIDSLYDAIEKVGEATATQPKANALINNIQKRLGAIQNLTKDKTKLRTLYVVQQDPLRIAGTDTFINEMIEIAGGVNTIGPTIQKYPPIGAEQLLASNPEVIIIPAMGLDLQTAKENTASFKKKFAKTSAVKNNRIYVISDDTLSQLGPRIAEGAEVIAKCLRPELFSTENE